MGKGSLVSSDMHWYRDGEINLLLRHMLADHPEVELLTSMLGTDWHGSNVLAENLMQFQMQRNIPAAPSAAGEVPLPVKNKILVPINLGDRHWVLVCICYQADHVDLYYIDPYGHEIEKDVEFALNHVFPGTAIISSAIQLQTDGYNCGPWIIEVANIFIREGRVPEAGEVDIVQARIQQQEKLATIALADPDTYADALPPEPERSAPISAEFIDRIGLFDELTTAASPMSVMELTESASLSISNSEAYEQKVNTEKTVEDMLNLQQLQEKIQALLALKEPSVQAKKDFLTYLVTSCNKLSRNKDDAGRIRNRYGKVNYRTSAQNKSHLDFETWGFFDKVSGDLKDKFFVSFEKSWPEFKAELQNLADNIQIILSEQLARPEIKEACSETFKEKKSKSAQAIIWKNLPGITQLFAGCIDVFCLRRLSDPELLKDLQALRHEKDPLRQKYAIARILVIVGELAKNMSLHFKDTFPYLSLKTLKEIRNAISHAHFSIVAGNSTVLIDQLDALVAALADLQEELRSLLEEADSAMSSDGFDPAKLVESLEERAHLAEVQLRKNSALYTKKPPEKMKLAASISKRDKVCLFRLRQQYLTEFKNRQKMKLQPPQARIAKAEGAHDSSDDLARIRILIASLEALPVRTEAEDNKLKAIKKHLDKLLKPTKQLSKPTVMKTEMVECEQEAIKSTIEAADVELKEIEGAAFFNQFKQALAGKDAGDNPKPKLDVMSKRKLFIQGIKDELKVLQHLIESKLSDEQRDYAFEQCFAAIGQYMRDLNDLKDEELREIQARNQTVGGAVTKTIAGRNLSAHDPIENHYATLRNLAHSELFAIANDVSAIHALTKDQLADFERQLFGGLASYYNNLGNAYFRLNFIDRAYEYFAKALETFSPEHICRSLGWDSAETILIDADGSCLNNTTVIVCKMAKCMLRKGKVQEAYELLMSKYSECIAHHAVLDRYTISLFFGELGSAMFQRALVSRSDWSIFHRVRAFLHGHDDYNVYASFILDSATAFYRKGDFKRSIEVLREISFERISAFYTRYLYVYYQILFKTGALVAELGLSTDALLGQTQEVMESIRTLLRSLEGAELDFKTRNGEAGRVKLEELRLAIKNCIHDLAASLGSKAAALLNTIPQVALQLIEATIAIQREFLLDHSISLHTQAQIYLALADNTSVSNMTEVQTYWQRSMDTINALLTSEDPRILAGAYEFKAYLYRRLNKLDKEIFCLIESLFWSEKIIKKQQSDLDVLTDAAKALNCIMKEQKPSLEKYATDLLLRLNEAAELADKGVALECKLRILTDYLAGSEVVTVLVAEKGPALFAALNASVAGKAAQTASSKSEKKSSDTFCGFKPGFLNRKK